MDDERSPAGNVFAAMTEQLRGAKASLVTARKVALDAIAAEAKLHEENVKLRLEHEAFRESWGQIEDERDAALAAAFEAKAKCLEMQTILRDIEWVTVDYDSAMSGMCPCCEAEVQVHRDETIEREHKPDCALKKLIDP